MQKNSSSFIVPPEAWLIVLLAGISMLSETVYSPALPSIAHALHTSAAMVEYTLTIYFFGFALGTLFWGKLSDHMGRKPGIVGGLVIFVIGCIGCYCSHSIAELMLSRLIQSFGASIGSVLMQAVCRDALHGPALGKMYSLIGSSLAIFPTIGPILGGFIAEHFGWANIFLVLIIFGTLLTFLVIARLYETHHQESRIPVSMPQVAWKLLHDKKVIAVGIIIAGVNGISFSYFAEGSFYFIKLLGLSPSDYGLTFMVLATGTFFGGLISRRLHKSHSSEQIMSYGIRIVFWGAVLFLIVVLSQAILSFSKNILIVPSILSQATLSFGICMTSTNALAIALAKYKWCVGTASSLFGFSYYMGISLFTLGMGSLHNGTLLPMPLYFLGISLLLLCVQRIFLPKVEVV